MISTPKMGALKWGDYETQEFCNIICEAPAVQVQAHGYALEYVEKLSLSAAQDKRVCVGDTLEQKDGNYPPVIKRGKLGKSIINGGLFLSGKSTINWELWELSFATFDDQRVFINQS